MADLRLNTTDEAILDELVKGRCTPRYLEDQLDVSRQYINERLTRLREHGIVERLSPGLYELVDDPRENNSES